MKSVAIVGMGESWRTAKESKADEMWTINYFYENGELQHPDRVFDMHDLYWYRDSQDKVDKHISHWDYLKKEKDFIFYAPLDYPEVPNLTVYPLNDAMKLLKGFRRNTDELIRFFTSSFDYMVALAILEGFERIELHGWSMGWNPGSNETEYTYQLPGLGFWTGMAVSRGIEVVVNNQSPIFKIKQYTFDGENQMITRQTLETFSRAWLVKLEQEGASFHKAQGKYESLVMMANHDPKNKVYQDSAQKGLLEVNEAFKQLMFAEGAVGMIRHLLAEVDLAEIDLDIKSCLVKSVSEAVEKADKS